MTRELYLYRAHRRQGLSRRAKRMEADASTLDEALGVAAFKGASVSLIRSRPAWLKEFFQEAEKAKARVSVLDVRSLGACVKVGQETLAKIDYNHVCIVNMPLSQNLLTLWLALIRRCAAAIGIRFLVLVLLDAFFGV